MESAGCEQNNREQFADKGPQARNYVYTVSYILVQEQTLAVLPKRKAASLLRRAGLVEVWNFTGRFDAGTSRAAARSGAGLARRLARLTP